jgi:aerobic carbon-monoxide dehydrogenase medium subunit
VKAAAFRYEAPDDLGAALTLLAEHGDEAKVLAGGQSLVPLLNLRLATPSVVIDIRRLAEIADHRDEAGHAYWGALVRHADVEDGVVPDPTGGLLQRVAGGIGYRVIRNAGTVGGSLAHADAAGEWCTVLPALDATATVASLRGTREIRCRDLLAGYFTTTLEPDELIIGIDVPGGGGWRAGYRKFARKAGEFAESIALALVATSSAGDVTAAELWLGAAAGVPLRLTGAESALIGATWSAATRDAVYAEVVRATEEHGTEQERRYRCHLHGVMVGRAIADAVSVPGGTS